MNDKDTKLISEAYNKIYEGKVVQWDDIPFKVQRQIYKLEKSLEQFTDAYKLGNRSKEVTDTIKEIKAKIAELEAPYTT